MLFGLRKFLMQAEDKQNVYAEFQLGFNIGWHKCADVEI